MSLKPPRFNTTNSAWAQLVDRRHSSGTLLLFISETMMTGAANSDGMLIIHDVWGKHRRQTCYLPVFKHGPWNNRSVTHLLQQQPKENSFVIF